MWLASGKHNKLTRDTRPAHLDLPQPAEEEVEEEEVEEEGCEPREETNTAGQAAPRRKSCGVAQRNPQVTWPRLIRVVADMEVSEDLACVIEGIPGPGPLNGDVKRSLANYFEIKRKSGGGDCTVEEKDGTVVVRFNSGTVRDRVLQRNTHTIELPGFGTTHLKLQPFCKVPPVPPKSESSSTTDANEITREDLDSSTFVEGVVVCGADEFGDEYLKLYAENVTKEPVDVYPLTKTKLWLDCSQEAVQKMQAVKEHAIGNKRLQISVYSSAEIDAIIDKRRLILTGFPTTIQMEMINLYVASITDAEVCDIEYLKGGEVAVVTFINPIDWKSALKICAKRQLVQYKITATMLDASNCLLVEASKGNLCEDLLTLYFENSAKSGGGPLSDVHLEDNKAAAYLSFLEPAVAQKVVSRKHKLNEAELKVYPYYHALASTLGKQIRIAKPEPFDIVVDSEIIQFISKHSSSMDQLKDILKKANTSFSLGSNGKITLTSKLNECAVNFQSLASKWQQTAKICFLKFCEMYSKTVLPCSKAAWERVKQEVSNHDHVLVDYDSQQAHIIVSGRNQDVQDVCKQMQPIVKKVQDDLLRESQIISDRISLESPDKYHLIQMLEIEADLRAKFKESELTFDEKSYSLTVKGMPQDCQKIKDEISKHLKGISSKEVKISSNIVMFLKMLGRDILNTDLFSNKIHAKIQLKNNNSISITAFANQLGKAESFIEKTFTEGSFTIPEESMHATRGSEWTDLLSYLEENKVDSISQVFINKSLDDAGFCMKVSVAGFGNAVDQTCQELNGFCEKHLRITEQIPIKSRNILKYLQEYEKIFEDQTLLNKNVKTLSETLLEVSGHPDDVDKIKNLFEKKCSEIVLKSVKFNKPGAAKYIRENESVIKSIAEANQNCMVLIDVGGAAASQQVGMQLKCQEVLSANLAISIYKGDILKSQVDIIINAADTKMCFKSGFGKVLSEAAGPDTSRSCAQYIQDNGEPQPGEAVMSVPGKLPCKSVAHVICQLFEKCNGNVDMSKVVQLKQGLKKALKLVGTRGHQSAALPGLVFQNSGYPLEVCAKALIDAVAEFGQVNDPGNCLTDVLFIDLNDNVVHALVNALLSKVGKTPIATPQTRLTFSLPASVKIQSSTAVSTSPTCMITKEGLNISLVVGSIENENSDVIINTTSANMKMDSGGVSSAIFRKAGPTLQTLVDTAIQGQSISSGKIVKTDVTGLNLQCQALYHTTLGSWDNGNHLKKFMKRSLEMAHRDGVSSISFPALGTGNLKYSPLMVSSFMFEEVINFSQNHQGTTLKDIRFVIFSKDQLVISDFQAELAQRLLGKTSIPPTLKITSKAVQRAIGKISVEVVDGDITKEKVDAIVNSTNTSLDLDSGVSKAILAAAGPTVAVELATFGAQPADGVVTTSAGSLNCKKIVHMVGQTDFAKMTNSILKVLDECSKLNCHSVSFPALSTGKGGIKPGPVADTILEAFEMFSLQNPQSIVSHIRIMVLQPEIKTAFTQALIHFQPGGKQVQPPQTSSITEDYIRQYGLKLHGATVEAVSGDITKETTDAIVNSTTTALVFMSGVSGAILKAAGQVVVDECTKLGPQPGDGVVVTSGGALSCKHIVHMVGQTNPASIKSSVLKVLQECEVKKVTSVSFPATGTGAGSVPAVVVANAMMEGIEEHIRVHTLMSPLKHIRFVIFQPEMLKDFQQALINMSQMTVSSTGTGTNTPSPRAPQPVHPKPPLPPKKTPQIKSSYNNEAVTIDVYGKLQKEVDDICKQTEGLLDRNCMAYRINIDCVESLDKQELNKLETIEKTCDVRVSIKTSHISIEGLNNDVCKAIVDVTQMIHELKIKLEKENFEQNYVPKQELPADWAQMQGTEFLKVTLNVQSPEYQQVQANFRKSVNHLKIIKIERIQNLRLYNAYQAMKTSIENSNKGQGTCEKNLFHGTQVDSIDNISHFGFNRSFAGRNATAYGVGTYFALNSSYSSSDTYSRPDANGTKYMYQARVLTGSYCAGNSSMKEPPLKNLQNKTERFDCVVDNPITPSIFVIFNDNLAYPEYLISFSK
ncbi:protein mono-ADP-ribosyltransferase PARP14-like [Petromyzon marinus]|uniref:protein mono-ADP-ribosyltransferase PARP14-like n=1 Tax=Petromyzon marinus TaxID=7757 RepID=UPI003F724320